MTPHEKYAKTRNDKTVSLSDRYAAFVEYLAFLKEHEPKTYEKYVMSLKGNC